MSGDTRDTHAPLDPLFAPSRAEDGDAEAQLEAELHGERLDDLALITLHLSGDLPEADAARVRERLAQDEAFRRAAEPVFLAWESGRARNADGDAAALERGWEDLRRRLGLASPVDDARHVDLLVRDRRPSHRSSGRWWWRMQGAAAAAAAAVVMTLGPWVLRRGAARDESASAPMGIVRERRGAAGAHFTGIDETMTVLLSDRVRATLGHGSRIAAVRPLTVKLDGEATFETMVPLALDTLTVETAAGRVRATQGQFRVHQYPGEPEATVTVSAGRAFAWLQDATGRSRTSLEVPAGWQLRFGNGRAGPLQPASPVP